MTLDPKLQSGIGFNQPVQQPSLMGGVADLAGLFVNTSTPKGPSESDKKRAFDQGLNNSLITAYDEAEQLRSEGLDAQANRRIRRGHLEFARQGGNINAPETQGLIESITGRPAERSGLSDEEFTYNQTIQSDEFQTSFLSTYTTHPDATPEEREQIAFTRLQRTAATQATIEETKHDWNVGEGQASRIQAIMDWQKANEGAIFVMGEEGARVSQDDVQVAMQEFGRLSSYITASRPAGISAEEWKPVEDALAQTKEQLKLAERLTSVEEITNDALLSTFKAIRETKGFTVTEQNIAIMFLSRNPEVLQSVGAFSGSTMKDILEMSMKVDTTKVDESIETGTGNGTTAPAEGTSSFSDSEFSPHVSGSPEQNFKDAASAAKLAGGVKNVVADPEVFGQWVSLTSSGLAALTSMASKNNAWASSEGYNKYFTPQFFRAMDEIKHSGDPNAYRALFNKTNEAIDANITALRANIVSRTDGDFVLYDKATNSLQFDKEAFKNTPRISESEKAAFMRLVDSRFGGDFMEAITFRSHDLPNINKISRELNDNNVKQRIEAITNLEIVRGRLAAPEALETEGGEGEDNLEGSQGGDAISSPGAVELLKESEGFRTGAYWDVNAWRTGYGSDTVTRADGSIEKVTKGTKVTKADAERDLARRTQEFADTAAGQVGRDIWTNLPGNVTDALTSVAYNYGSLPKRILPAVKSGDPEAIAEAVESLGGDNDGVNRKRRRKEAAIIRGTATPPNTASPVFAGRPEARPQGAETILTEVTEVITPQGGSTGGAGGALETSEVSEDGTQVANSEGGPDEAVTPKAAEQEWATLSAQTKTMLERVFGSKEEFIEALVSGEVNKEDIT